MVSYSDKIKNILVLERIIKAAENIAYDKGFNKIAVISGIGVGILCEKWILFRWNLHAKLLPVFS